MASDTGNDLVSAGQRIAELEDLVDSLLKKIKAKCQPAELIWP